MRELIVMAGIAATLALATADAVAARQAGTAPTPKPNSIDISYGTPESKNNRPIHDLLKERQALEKLRGCTSVCEPSASEYPFCELQTRQARLFACCTVADVDGPVLERLPPHDDPDRRPEEIGVGELLARPLVTVVETTARSRCRSRWPAPPRSSSPG